MGEPFVDPKAKVEIPAGEFNLNLPRGFLERLLNDEALYAYVGPYLFFFQLDDGQKACPVVQSVDEFRAKRGVVFEWRFGHVGTFTEPEKEITYV